MANCLEKNSSFGNISFDNFHILEKIDISMNNWNREKNMNILPVIRNCNNKKILEIYNDLKKKKKNLFDEFKLKKTNLLVKFSKYLPTIFIKYYIDFLNFFSYSLSIDFFGYEKDKFGKAFFFSSQNRGSFEKIYLPCSKKLNTCFIIFMNKIKDIPCIKENGDFGVERILNLSMTADHRYGDGSVLIPMVSKFNKVFENPEEFV